MVCFVCWQWNWRWQVGCFFRFLPFYFWIKNPGPINSHPSQLVQSCRERERGCLCRKGTCYYSLDFLGTPWNWTHITWLIVGNFFVGCHDYHPCMWFWLTCGGKRCIGISYESKIFRFDGFDFDGDVTVFLGIVKNFVGSCQCSNCGFVNFGLKVAQGTW